MTTRKITTPPESQLPLAIDQIKLGLKKLQSALDDIALRIHKVEGFHCQFERDLVYWRDRAAHLKDVNSMDLWAEAKHNEDKAIRQVNRLSVYIDDLKKQYDASYDLLFQSSKLLSMDLNELQKATTVFMESKAILRDLNEKPSIKVQPKELTVDEQFEILKRQILG